MAITVVNEYSAEKDRNGSLGPYSLGFTPTSGNVLVYVIFQRNGGTFSDPSGWTLIAQNAGASGFDDTVAAWIRESDGTETTINVPSSTGGGSSSDANRLVLIELDGATATVRDSDTKTNSASTALSTTAVTVAARDAVFGAWAQADDTSRTFTPGTGYTNQESGYVGAGFHPGYLLEWKVAAAAGTEAPDATSTANAAWRALSFAIVAEALPAGGYTDWEDDGFGEPLSLDDIGPYIESWKITRGASAEITGGAQPGSARITLKNHAADRFNPLNTGGPLYGLLTDGVAVHLSVNSDGALTGDEPRGLFGGRIRSITPKPVPGATYAPFVELVCEDALGWYRRTPCRIADDLNRSHRDIRDAVLAEIGETRVDLARETRKVPLSGWDGDALSALEAINRANGTRHFIKPADDADTWYAYTTRNRQWRLDATTDFTIDAGTDHVLSDGWTLTADTVINQQRATVTPVIFTQAAIEVWTAEDVPFSVKTGSPKVIWVEFDDYVDAPTLSVNRTGSTLTTAIESYGSTAKVTLTSAGTTTVTRIAINGRLARRLPSVSFVADDTTSQAGARGLRAGSDISGEFVGTISAAEGMAAHVVWRFGNPQFRPTLTITNWFPEMFEIDLFDTIAVTIDQLGMTARIFEVVGYQMDGYMAGTDAKLHVLRLVLQESRTQTDPGWFVLDTSELDDTDILGY